MPAQLTYPGVYIEEIPSGVRTIIGVATSITAFLGRAFKGPVNDPFTINSYSDFERNFGGMQSKYPMSYAVRDFFLNGGSQAIIVRLIHPNVELDFEKGKKILDAAKQVYDEAEKGVDANDAKAKADAAYGKIQNDANKSKEEKDAAKNVLNAANAGTTLQSIIEAAKKAMPPDPATFAKRAVLRLRANSSMEDRAYKAAKLVHDEAKKGEDANAAKAKADAAYKKIQNDANKSQEEKDAAKNVFNALNAKVTLPDIIKAAEDALPKIPDPLVLDASSEGTWGDTLRARIDYDNIDTVGDRYKPLTKDDLFNLTVRDMSTGDTERFICVAVKDSSRSIDRVLRKESRMVQVRGSLPNIRPKESDEGISDEDKKIKPFSDEDLKAGKRSVGVADSDKGFDGSNLDANDYTTGPGLEDRKWGLFALDKADMFNLLCIPPDIRADPGADDVLKIVHTRAEKYCKDRRALLIVDPPFAWGKNRATAASDALKGLPDLGLTGAEGTNAAIYFPRVQQTDPMSENQVETFAACGIIAGIMSRTDMTRGVWKAPAGLDASLTGIIGLQVNLNDAENGMLNPLGINCLRDFGILGRVIWGARTLRGADQLASEWKYIPVRRTALFIEESLFRGTQWVVFEPNDEPLWAQIRLNVGAFMHGLFRQGAFQGTTPKDAYFVKCDKETTTQADRDKGIVNIIVGFAPLKPAEFVVIKIQQIAGQIET